MFCNEWDGLKMQVFWNSIKGLDYEMKEIQHRLQL